MSEFRESDLLSTKMDLVNLSMPENLSLDRESFLLNGTSNSNSTNITNFTNNPQQPQHSSTSTMSQRGGFCVREYEENLEALQKENFNLRLRLFYYDQNNPKSLPEDSDSLLQQNYEFRIENETLLKELEEKKDLLCQAHKALELLEQEKNDVNDNFERTVEQLNEKIQSLNNENHNLQQALGEIHDKTNLANETGYAEFMNAMDTQSADTHRKLLEITKHAGELEHKLNEMSSMYREMEMKNKNLSDHIAKLQYEKEELKNDLNVMQASSNDLLRKINFLNELIRQKTDDLCFYQDSNDRLRSTNKKLQNSIDDLNIQLIKIQECSSPNSNLEIELKEFKEKWAASQCDLHDALKACNEKEEERQNALKLLQSALEKLKEEQKLCTNYKEMLEKKKTTNKDDTKKDDELEAIKRNVETYKQKIQQATTKELQEKNREIERLTALLHSLKSSERHSVTSEPPRFSFDHLYETFNDLQYQQAMEIKKQSQQKIDVLVHELEAMNISQPHQRKIENLKNQIETMIEKQEITDNALTHSIELYGYTMDHLQELAQFLATLLQNKEIRESLSEGQFLSIQNILEKSVEFTSAGRQSFGNPSISNMSAIEFLVNAARQSISNIREMNAKVYHSNKAIQTATNENPAILNEYEDLKRVNQLLEDEIEEHKKTMKFYKKKAFEMDEIKADRDEIYEKLQKAQMTVEELTNYQVDLKTKYHQQKSTLIELQNQLLAANDEVAKKSKLIHDHTSIIEKTNENLREMESLNMKLNAELEETQNTITSLQMEKVKFENMWLKSDEIAKKLEMRLKEIESDLNVNWITKEFHSHTVEVLQNEIVSAESQIAAIRMELEKTKNEINDDKENVGLRKIDISEDRKLMLMGQSALECEKDDKKTSSCEKCEECKAKVIEMKYFVKLAVDRLKKSEDEKTRVNRIVKDQLSKTENVMQTARNKMETVLKLQNKN